MEFCLAFAWLLFRGYSLEIKGRMIDLTLDERETLKLALRLAIRTKTADDNKRKFELLKSKIERIPKRPSRKTTDAETVRKFVQDHPGSTTATIINKTGMPIFRVLKALKNHSCFYQTDEGWHA